MRRLFRLCAIVGAVAALSLPIVSAQESTPAVDDAVPVLQVVDTLPLAGEELGLDEAITVYFDRDLDCATVNTAAAITPEVAGEFTCDGSTVMFTPSEGYARGETYLLTFSDALRGEGGAQLLEPFEGAFATVSFLRVTSTLPTDAAVEAAADTVLTVIFNRPVVPLGIAEDAATLPNPVTIEPAVEGVGEWLNTSIFTFTPAEGWASGTTYTVTVADVTAVDESVLEAPYTFSFTTAVPQVVEVLPLAAETAIPLDASVQVTFNQPIDQASAEANFSLRPGESETSVPGAFEWNDEGTGFRFTPTDLLTLDTVYTFGFPEAVVQAASGDATLAGFSSSFATVPAPAIVSTDPPAGATDARPYGGFTLFFASSMNAETLNDKITISPEPALEAEFYYQDYNNSLQVTFSPEPSTTYTISLAPGMEDVYGNAITEPFSFTYTTAAYDPSIQLVVPSEPAGFYDAGRETTSLYLTHRNVSQVDLSLYNVSTLDFVNAANSEEGYYRLNERINTGTLLKSWIIPNVAPPNVLRYELLDLGAPVTGGAAAVECANVLPSRTNVGDTVQVISDPDPVRVRAFPPDGEILELLYRGSALRVIGGPTCANDLLWWEVELSDERTGWVAEAVTDEYLIEVTIPGGTPAPLVSPESTAEVFSSEALTGGALQPGIYQLRATAPQTAALDYRPLEHVLVVGTANLTMKVSVDRVTVWATDVRSGEPLANVEVALYGTGETISRTTDAQGVVQFDIPRQDDLYNSLTAVLDDGTNFGVGYSEWTFGIDPYQFDVRYAYFPRQYAAYLYTDRALYRPGQPVYFRGVVRQKDDVSYTPPPFETVPVVVRDFEGTIVFEDELPLTEFGTFTGQFNLADDAGVGYYNLTMNLPSDRQGDNPNFYEGDSVGFDVAQYRVPEFDVEVTAAEDAVVQGATIPVTVNSTYFFGGAVPNADVQYNVGINAHFFEYEGEGRYDFYDVDVDTGDAPGRFFFDPYYGENIASGSGVTDAEGSFTVDIPATLVDEGISANFTIEATVTDESNLAVSGRTTVTVHQGLLYIGASPERYVGTAGENSTINLISVGWDSEPRPNVPIRVEVVERRWSSVQELDQDTGRATYTYDVEEIPVTTGEVTTGEDGSATFDFVPPQGGIYKVKIATTDANGNTINAATTLYVSDQDYITWRQSNDNRIELIADRDEYEVGDTAEILITSPFQGTTEALVTVERGDVMTYERLTLDSNSRLYEVPITEDFAPTIYVSVVLVKGVDVNNPVAGLRMGMVELAVDPERKEINLDIATDTEQAGPRDTVTYTIRATDYLGNPVRAEVGAGLTDLAVLSLSDVQYTLPIMEYFYGPQPLGIRTSAALTVNTDQLTQFTLDTVKGGGGGGGDFGVIEVREDFVDTPFWEGTLVTDEDGEVSFEVTLPDNLTTWRLDARAVTGGEDGQMLVGQETFDLLSTKPLLVRPVVPRFFVQGDQAVVASVINNNTADALTVEAALEITGVSTDDDLIQTVEIPANSSGRVEWNVTVDGTDSVEAIFYASANEGALADAARPQVGQGVDRLLPIYRYEAPETVGTGGVLRSADTRVEAIVLPQRFAVTQGSLTIRLEPSLAATTLDTVEDLQVYDGNSTEVIISRFLPYLVTLQTLDQFGVTDSSMRVELENAVEIFIQRLAARQRVDGGWVYYVNPSNPNAPSDSLLTAYALIALAEARDAGFSVDPTIIENARNFLDTQFIVPDMSQPTWRLNRQAFILYALARAGTPDVARMATLYDTRERLDIYAQALLALAFSAAEDTSDRVDTLLDDIQAAAVISANGAHWEEAERDPYNWGSDTRTTAIALYTLLTLRPESELNVNAVRWLMVARRGDTWETTQETAWALLALNRWMEQSGELQPNYTYGLAVNDETLVEQAAATPETLRDSQTLSVAIADLLQDNLNRVEITRSEGEGALYYTAYLNAFLPVPEIEPLNQGVIVQRRYTLQGSDETITEARIGELVEVHVTVIAPNDLYFVRVEDPLPAGTEALDPRLATNQQVGTQTGMESAQIGVTEESTEPEIDADDPLSRGWGYWLFDDAQVEDEQVVLNATYLPAGTYEYVYTIRPSFEGTYNVIPPTAYEFYFPEVYGRGAGSTFTVLSEAE